MMKISKLDCKMTSLSSTHFSSHQHLTAQLEVYQSVERQFQPLIAGITDGKKDWQILKENLEPTSRPRLTGLIDEFFELNYNAEEENIGTYCKRVQEKCELIKDSGFELPEELVCFQLIRKLPQDYDNLVQILYRLDKDEFTVKNIQLQLINEFGRVQQKREDELHRNVANAYETRISRKTEDGKSLGTRSGFVLKPVNRSKTSYQSVCFRCSTPGHVWRNCRQKIPSSKNCRRFEEKGQQDKSRLPISRKAFYSEISGLGIKMERTSVYTPGQNGVAERFNRTAVEDSSSDMEEEQDEPGYSIADAKAATNVLNNFFATENIYEHVVDLFKIVDKQIDELYIKSKAFQPKITSFSNVVGLANK
ncbi:hypothetical protein AVEN_45577-1 [Araneus ventricosus]|uniref:CCHC-type domain-containing protein n=1 Tax=Araneus ventricosus TaxID=182803 RepID=A0A4Y2PJW0_ARAVE|nr:hypothetical protein AVEN_45577-1 [Araneus ventricosus]